VKKPKVLRPVFPNAGLQVKYRRRLDAMIDAMHASFTKWVLAAYRADPPAMQKLAQDQASLALDAAKSKTRAQKVVDELTKRWLDNFDEGAERLAAYFAKAAGKRSDAQLRKILQDAGFSIDFEMTAAQREILASAVAENVGLIKSIPEQYLKDVQVHVASAVQTGMDVGGLSKKLEQSYGVSKRRAKIISLDQNTKITSAFTRSRQLEIGAEQAVWKHSHAGKKPRPTHVKNDGELYDVRLGWLDPAVGERIFPGQLINCRCTSRTVIPGFI